MGTKDHLLSHQPQESGCRMWTPIIPPDIERQATAEQPVLSSGKSPVFAPEDLKPALGEKVFFVP